MKKHFLLLMLVALLPLAGWAQTGTFKSVIVGEFTYGDASLPTPEITNANNQVVGEGNYTVSEKAYSDQACNTPVEINKLQAGKTYYLSITGKSSYNGAYIVASFTVKKATLEISYTGSLDRGYGEDQVALEVSKFGLADATGYKNSDTKDVLKGSMPTGYSTADNNAGTNKPVTFVGGWTADNYNVTYSAKLTITPKALDKDAVTVGEIADVVYKGAAYDPQVKVTIKDGNKVLTQGINEEGKYNDYIVVANGSSDLTNVGNPSINIVFKGNYSGTLENVKSFNITAAPITVSLKKPLEVTYTGADLKDQSKNSEAAWDYSGFVGSDATNPETELGKINATSATINATTEAKEVGVYTLELAGVTTTSTNYEIKDYLPSQLTINPIKLEIAAVSVEKKAGAADPAFVLDDLSGSLLSGDAVEGVSFTRVAGEDAGKYAITPDLSAAKVIHTDAKGNKTDVSAHYNLTIKSEKGQLTISPSGIVITIKNAEKFYGQEDPEFTYEVTGLTGDDKITLGEIKRDKSAKDPEAVGTYSLTAATPANPNPANYENVTVVPALLTINKAKLFFTVPAQNIEKGKTANDLSKAEITATGINNSDKLEDLYELAFGTEVSVDASSKTTTDQTVTNGVKLTLTTAAADCYVLVDKDGKEISGAAVYGKLIVGNGTTKAIAFKSNKDDYAKIVAQAGETQKVTLTIAPRNAREVPAGTKHTWKGGIWNAMVLPFEAKVRDISAALGYAIVNVVNPTATTEGNVAFKLEMGTIPANTPFMVKTDADIKDDTEIEFTGVKIVAPADEYPSVEAGLGYKFVGAYKEMTINNETPDYHFMRGDVNKLAHIGATSANTWTIVPFDAYLDQSGASDAARLMDLTVTFEELDGTTTAIRAIDIDNESAGSKSLNGWYNLNGVQIDAPTQKGIYIHNGKKVVIK